MLLVVIFGRRLEAGREEDTLQTAACTLQGESRPVALRWLVAVRRERGECARHMRRQRLAWREQHWQSRRHRRVDRGGESHCGIDK